ncbi:MAG: hypothetical protein IJQ73_07185 [Kiritimatiellae bacterium]|nr:hypothetical protein [Kiritimatiellia bacterium]
MNRNSFKWAIMALLVLNLAFMAVLLLRGGGQRQTGGPSPAEPSPSTDKAPTAATTPAPPPPPKAQPLALRSCEQISMSSNRLARVRLVFSGAVDTNSLSTRLSFKADGKVVASRIVSASKNSVTVDLLDPVPGTLALATVGEGTLPAPGSTLLLPTASSATLGCALSPGLAIQDVQVQAASPGAVRLIIHLNQQATAENAADFIRVTPAVDFSVSAPARDYWRYMGNEVILSGPFEAGRKYKVEIAKGLPSAGSEILMKPFSAEVSVPSFRPSCAFASPGRYLPPSDSYIVPFQTVNLTNIEVVVTRLLPQNLVHFVMRETDRYDGWRNWNNDDGENAELLDVPAATIHLPVRAERDKTAFVACSLGETVKKHGNGAYLVEAHPSSANKDDQPGPFRKVICASNIGLSLFLEEEAGAAHVWTTALNTGAPLPGVTVALYSDRNERLGEAVSDSAGLAKISFDSERGDPVAVVGSTREGDLTFLPVAHETSADTLQEGDRPFVDAADYEAFVFADRGIFRPGETVFLQALVRDGRAAAPATAFPVEIRVRQPDGKLYRKLTLMPDARGSLKTEIPIPEFLPSGRYYVSLDLPGGKSLGDMGFLVESFVPPQIKVSVVPERENAKPGEKVSVTVRAEHLYGAPAEGLRAESLWSLHPLDFKPAGWERYTFGNRAVKFTGEAGQKLGTARLDAEGSRALTIAIPANLRGPARAKATVRGTVFESGGRTVTAYGSVVIDLVPYYIGLDMTGRDWLKSGEEVSIPWAAVRPDGEPEAGVATLEASLIRIDEHWNFTTGEDGRCVWHCEKTESKVADHLKIAPGAADGKGLCTFRVPEWGKYRLVVADGKTGASSSATFHASSWAGKQPEATDAFTKLKVKPDKKHYVPGETAILQFSLPFAGDLFLVLRQGKVLQTRAFAVTNKTVEVGLPITASIVPGVEVFATVVRAVKPEEVWAPHRALGSCFVSVRPPERALRVDVAAPEVIRPSATAEVTVRVASEKDGSAPADARVTLFAVDEGICGLTDHKTPDPTDFFFTPRYGLLAYYDVYTRLTQVTDSKLTGFLSHVGGGDETTAIGKRLNPISARRFRPLSLATYDVAVTNGAAVIPVAIPEFTGQVRFMAIAWTASATGSAEAFSRVRRNLVVQPDLPRVLAPGDKSFLTIPLDNTTSSSVDVSIAVACEGPVTAGKAPDAFTMAGRTRRTLLIPVEATESVGVGRVSVRVEGSGEVFADTIEIPVRPAAPWRTTSQTIALAAGEAADFQSATGILASSASQMVEILPRPVCDIRAALAYLTDYPYGCAEQTTSAAFPFLSVARLPAGYFPEELCSRAESFINAAVVRDLTMQRYYGFSMWPDSESVSSFATYYVIQFLAEARRAGFARELIAPASLLAVLEHRSWEAETPDERCHRALDCALLEKPERALQSDLFSERATLPLEARAKLARAFALSGDPQRARTLLEEAGDPTDLRSAAYLLAAWVELDPANPRCAVCLDKVNACRDPRSGHWNTTHDNALAINALVAHAAAQGPEEREPVVSASLAVLTGGKQETVVFPQGASATWKSQAGQGNAVCRVTNTGDATCFVRRAFTAVPLAAAEPPISNGLIVVREYLDREGRAIDPAKLRQGDIVVVRLRVACADDRDDLVVEDLLPACLEPECQNLVTEGGLGWLPQDDSWRWVRHREFRDDRVLLFSGDVKRGKAYTWLYSARLVSAGEYIVPAVQASAMYDPRIVARGAPSRLTVEK